MKVKFATYNIQYGVGQDHCYDLSRIVNTLKDQDIVCLQEATTNWQVCENDNQPEALATQLNLYMAYTPEVNGCVVSAYSDQNNLSSDHFPLFY